MVFLLKALIFGAVLWEPETFSAGNVGDNKGIRILRAILELNSATCKKHGPHDSENVSGNRFENIALSFEVPQKS